MNLRYWRWSVGTQLLRLPSMMAPLAFAVLATQVTGSYRLGGLMMAVFVGAEVSTAGLVGRLLDRVGVARGVRVLLVLSALCLCGLAAVSGSPVLMIVFVVLTGFVAGGLSGGMRALLPSAVEAGSLERAVAVDAMIIEGVVVGGPLVVALLSPLGGVVPVLGMAGSYLLAALFVPSGSAVRKERGVRPPLGSILSWLLCAFAFGCLCSTIEVASLPLAQRVGGGPGSAVIVIVVLTAASLLGAGLYAWLGPRVTLDRRIRAVLFLLGMALGAVLVAFGASWPLLVAGVAMVGLCIGPLNTTMSMHLQTTLPDERKAEGFSLIFTAQGAGFALGSLSLSVLPLAGALVLGAAIGSAAAGLIGAQSRTPVAVPVTVE
ncbi:MAG: MFS transporter [Kibdelosporangium sp.]